MLKKNKEQELQAEFYSIIADIAEHETVLKMKQYRQHYDTSTYEHCMHVAFLNYKIGKKLHLDYKALARAGMLHDLFLYDWRKSQRDVEIDGLHAFVHPKIAFQNASRLFDLNEKEKDIIVKHMWPVTLPLPKYKESFLITLWISIVPLQNLFLITVKCLYKKICPALQIHLLFFLVRYY